MEKENYDLATCCEEFSLQYEKSDVVQSELYYISSKTGKIYNPELDEIKSQFEANDIPMGPDEDVVGMAYAYGKHCFERKSYEAAVYFLEIVTGFYEDEEVNQMIEEAVENLKK